MPSPKVLEVVKLRNEGMSVDEAVQAVATKYDCTPVAIRSRYYRENGRVVGKVKAHCNAKLTDDEELALVCLLTAFSESGRGKTAVDVIDIVRDVFEVEVSETWVKRFRAKYRKYMKFCLPTYLGKKRTDDSRAWNDVRVFVEYMEKVIHKYPPHAIVNYDETRANIMKNSRMKIRRLESRRKIKNQFRAGVGSSKGVTILPFISAEGGIISVHVVYKNGATYYVPANEDRQERGQLLEVFEYFTDTGYVDEATFRKIVEDFRGVWARRYPGLHCLLLGDNLGVHNGIDVVRESRKEGVHLTFFPPNTTHWLQPLDNLFFAALKKAMASEKERLQSLASWTDEESLPFSYMDFIQRSMRKACTPSVIKRSFSCTGIFPWSPDLIFSLCASNHKKPLSDEDESTDEDAEEKMAEKDEVFAGDMNLFVEAMSDTLERCVGGKKKEVEKLKNSFVSLTAGNCFHPDASIRAFLAEQERDRKEREAEEKRIEKEKKEKERAEKKERDSAEKERKRREREEKKQRSDAAKEERKRKRLNREKEKAEMMANKEAKRAERKRKRLEKKKEVAEEKGRMKKKRKVEYTCQIRACGLTCTDDKCHDWYGCEKCDKFWICGDCSTIHARKRLVLTHEKRCGK